MEALTALFGSMMPFLNQLRPTKSPLVIIAVVLVAVLVNIETFDKAIHGWMFHIPLYMIVLVTIIVAFTYTPPELTEIANGTEPGDDDAAKRTEIEQQFKFSRAFCLTMGIVCLHLMFVGDGRKNVGSTLFVMVYAAVVLHVALFLGYTVLRTIREENVLKYAVFQLGFLTGLTLLGAVLCALKAHPDLANFPIGVEYAPSKGGAAIAQRWTFASCLVFLTAWATFIGFWIARLRKVIRFSVTVTG